TRFSASMSLEEQWRILQSKKVVVAAEGAFFAWSMFAAENSTWICIDNHTRPEGFEPVTSHYHANLALAYPWMRLIVYTIRHGHRAP
ncbi:DUF563 domain-containing protein, partial [Vibrio cholerae]|nr:DUF563 domain-containing protein [Vibrio cholerae]